MKKVILWLFAVAIVAYPVIDPRIPQEKATPSTAVETTAGGLIIGLDGGTYQPYSTAIIAKVQGALAAKGFYTRLRETSALPPFQLMSGSISGSVE